MSVLRGRAAAENGTCQAGAPIGARAASYHPTPRERASDSIVTVRAVSSSNWVRPVSLAVSCLILGFVGGWSLASIGGDDVTLPDASVDVTVEKPKPATTTVDTQAATPDRGAVAVVVYNGTSTAGLAARTATQLRGVGYTSISTGNTSAQSGPTVVYYREGAKPAADRLAADLQVETVTPIAGTPLASSAPGIAQLVVVLGGG